MRGKIAKEVGIGFIMGLLANAAGSYLYIFFLSQFKKLSVESTLNISLEQGLIGNIIVLGALLNFVVFFVFLKKKQYYRARGVIMATLVAAIFILISKFF
jgi:hypothetical protein